MSLRVRFWGTRGSIPSPGAGTVRYGGNTPCVEIRTPEGWLVILDAGTGIRELGRSLVDGANGTPVQGDIFLTHAHWDHIQGIPFFAPLFQRGNHFTIWGSRSLETSVDRVVRDQMSPVVFPVTFEELAATIDFEHVAPGTPSAGQGYTVTAVDVQHPGGALGYRFAAPGGGTLVYIPDNELGPAERYGLRTSAGVHRVGDLSEPQLAPRGSYYEDWRRQLLTFVRGASVLVHDTMYTTEEYVHHRGWGHSTYRETVELALEAGVETLVLFHHEPRRTDDEVDQRTEECRALVRERGGTLQVVAAAEGLTLTV